MRGKPHDPALRSKVVAELVTGNAPSEVAERYDLPIQTVSQWKTEASTEFVRTIGTHTRARADLVTLVTDLVTESITSLAAQARFASDTDWLTKQSAGDLAQYRGVEFDRLIRLLAAFRPADDAESSHHALEASGGPADPSAPD